MFFDEIAETRGFEQTQLTTDGMLHNPIVVSEIDETKDKLKWANITPLKLLSAESKAIDATKPHRVRFSVAGVHIPADVSQLVKVFDSKTGATSDANAKTVLKGKDQKLIIAVQFFVKDYSNFLTN